jgi:hypothetical protein
MISFELLTRWSRQFLHSLRTGEPLEAPNIVAEVFLIDRISGVLLCHLASDENVCVRTAPASLQFAGTLSTIMGFVKSSFPASSEPQELEQISLGSVHLCLQHGKHVVVATTVRGKPPQWLRPRLTAAVEEIEKAFNDSDDQSDEDGHLSRLENYKAVLGRCFKE